MSRICVAGVMQNILALSVRCLSRQAALVTPEWSPDCLSFRNCGDAATRKSREEAFGPPGPPGTGHSPQRFIWLLLRATERYRIGRGGVDEFIGGRD
jgi:hypothetical protein